MICRRYYVSGRVQGVFFRETTRRQAEALGVGGWVRNLRDGRVEALLLGDADRVMEMEKWLEIGPEHAKVTNIEKIEQQQAAPDISVNGFRVLPTA